jgi:L-ascorbate metabolism protein UlaG (beta-lactamase superfamily)
MVLHARAFGWLAVLTACAGSPYPSSDHFDGERFHNPAGEPAKGLGAVLRWKLGSSPPDWQTYPDLPAGPKPPARVADGELRVTFVNHATTLLQFDGLSVLTDPIWSERASPVSWAGPKRVRPPGIRFEDLPKIDLVLVSHDHYDHLDLPTLTRLARAHHATFVVPLGLATLLREEGIDQVVEHDWWQPFALLNGARGWVVPAQHFSARGLFDRDRTLWAGYVLESRGGPIFFAGDTAMSDHFAKVRARFGAMRLAVLPIGAFEPRWFMKPVHVDPAEALAAHHALAAQTSVGMHFGTFQLADESQTGAQEGLAAALARAPAPKPNFWVLGFGEGRSIDPLPPASAR